MAWFKFGKQDEASTLQAAASHESVDVLRQRAQRRLIGSAVLVLAAVIGFSLLFDTQPRQIVIDASIEIPDKARVKPLAVPVLPVPAAAGAKEETSSAPPTSAANATPTHAQSIPSVTPTAAQAATQTIKPSTDRAALEEATKRKVAAGKASDEKKAAQAQQATQAARAKALLEGKAPVSAAASPPASSEGRFVVQFGSFSDAPKAREARLKVEKAGMKTYTQVADTPAGKLIRVRVGPFATRAEADKVAAKIKSLDLPAVILTL